MQYGVILGKHLDISRAEIFAQGIHLEKHYGQIALFSDIKNVDLSKLGGIIKRGKVKTVSEITSTDLIGASTRELGSHLKKLGLCKRFKEVDPMHTDEEVKEKGQEYCMLADDMEEVLEITGYQDITRFSSIDFDKPINSMQIGMMPAKLTQIMVNIAIGKCSSNPGNTEKLQRMVSSAETSTSKEHDPKAKNFTIYDPFMGLGTTYMVANSLGYNVIGSDINITPAKQNLARWKTQKFAKSLPITLFSQDATISPSKPFLQHVDCIVTEGWLGHIVTGKTKDSDITMFAQEVEILYTGWLAAMYAYYTKMTIVCSIPRYTGGDNEHAANIVQYAEEKNISVSQIKQVYTRAGQKVGRKIVILERNK